MRDFLNLLNVTTTDVVEADDAYVVEARSTEPRFQACRLFCPIRKNGRKVREINDTPIHGKPVLIRMDVQRGSCTECGRTGLYETFPFVQPGFWMTRRLLDHIAKQAMRRTFAEVARESFIDPKTAGKAFHAYVDERIAGLKRETPRVLGLDEKMLLKSFRAVLGNVEARTVLNILPDREGSLDAYLRNIPNQGRIDVVCTDMFDGYRTMIRDVMPGRAHVTDKFHVVRRANTALDQIRADVARRMTDGRQRAGLRMARKLFAPGVAFDGLAAPADRPRHLTLLRAERRRGRHGSCAALSPPFRSPETSRAGTGSEARLPSAPPPARRGR